MSARIEERERVHAGGWRTTWRETWRAESSCTYWGIVKREDFASREYTRRIGDGARKSEKRRVVSFLQGGGRCSAREFEVGKSTRWDGETYGALDTVLPKLRRDICNMSVKSAVSPEFVVFLANDSLASRRGGPRVCKKLQGGDMSHWIRLTWETSSISLPDSS